MEQAEYDRLVADPAARQDRYQEMVRAYFDQVTDTYREKWCDSFHFAVFSGSETLAEAIQATERRIADEAGARQGVRLLDVGCGVGGPALSIAAYSGAHVTGVSIVPRQIEIARQRAAERDLTGQTRFEVADAMDLPFDAETFDAAYVFDASCHMPDKAAFCKQVARVLRPGGRFVGLDWMKKDGLGPADEAKYVEPICRLHGVPHLVSLPEWHYCLAGAGLRVELVEDASERGNILRNWEMVDTLAVKGIRGLLPWLIPPTLRMLTDGGLALARGARAGAFVIGHWIATKPGAPGAAV
jgi:ubiquinone/menaquinone biosynthesis C-methylase UbiE